MKNINVTKTCLLLVLFATSSIGAQELVTTSGKTNKEINTEGETMKTYVIEREIPDAGKLSAEQLKGIAQKSNEVLAQMGPSIQWLHSYVTDNKVYCIYKSESEELLKEHAEKGGFPINKISEMASSIDPSTGN